MWKYPRKIQSLDLTDGRFEMRLPDALLWNVPPRRGQIRKGSRFASETMNGETDGGPIM